MPNTYAFLESWSPISNKTTGIPLSTIKYTVKLGLTKVSVPPKIFVKAGSSLKRAPIYTTNFYIKSRELRYSEIYLF